MISFKSFNPHYLLATDSSASPAEAAYLHSRSKNPAMAGTKLFGTAKVRINNSIYGLRNHLR